MSAQASQREPTPLKASKKSAWIQEQRSLRRKLVTTDQHNFVLPTLEMIDKARESGEDQQNSTHFLRRVGGVDISFVKGTDRALACLVVVDIVTMEVVLEEYEQGVMTQPYIPGFLAFREVPLLQRLLNRVKHHPLFPEVILVDGNGVLHYGGFGFASHLGVVCDVPTVGVAKRLLSVDRIDTDAFLHQCSTSLKKFGDQLPIVGASGQVLGAALVVSSDDPQPVFVSIGHRVSLETSLQLATLCGYGGSSCIPEPTNQADLLSRRAIQDRLTATPKRKNAKAWTCSVCTAENPVGTAACAFCG